ncbi:DUF3159 domain-containing protein [Cellulomonas oligotrophica]|uniref:DUF3159 domain-containing protein n=1 Tax=Cellulomonas oligotrophica TaxID=931536 RepID=A0A7Y9JXC0_9CELL|nr:DUF3159 domain-containing protein [Cellulomonas oligotrophica]NYD84559.1 hypothetical protein [Cellulomonas oligotrophica]GIG31624.1 hypothetical protein Col01nite_07830 [Cellulomonas oligotrophica]
MDATDPVRDDEAAPARGMRAITADEFSALDAVGGVRGAVETVAPGLLFVVVFVATGQQLVPALVSAGAAALLAVVARLVQRTPLTQALSGVLGVGIGVLWAWRTGDATDFFAYGLLVNVAYLIGTFLTIVLGWPLVGLVVGMFRPDGPLTGGPWSTVVAWRADPVLRRRYALATWPWVAMFGLRLAVQLPLYYGGEVAWLGTAKLLMGLPLTALVLWVSWSLVRGSARAAEQPRPPHGP